MKLARMCQLLVQDEYYTRLAVLKLWGYSVKQLARKLKVSLRWMRAEVRCQSDTRLYELLGILPPRRCRQELVRRIVREVQAELDGGKEVTR